MNTKHKISFLLVSLLLLLQTTGAQQTATPASRIINAALLLQDVKNLSADEMQGRMVGTPAGAKARTYVVDRFKQAGLKSFGETFTQPFEFTNQKNEKIQGANVVGYIKGSKNADKYIVVTAHYDHVGVRGGAIFNGADDNASGTAALFAFAAYFGKNPPANSIIFVATDAEEAGLNGAKSFVAAPPVKKESILLNVNLDMIAHNDKNELYAAGTRHFPYLKTYLEETAKTAPVKLLIGHDQPNPPQDDWTNQSDHFAFYAAKIPFIYFGVEDHKDYHQPTDDFVNINQTFYVHAVETILEALKKFDSGLTRIEKQKNAATKK